MHEAATTDEGTARHSARNRREQDRRETTSTPLNERLWSESDLGDFFHCGPRKTHQIRSEPGFPDAVALGPRCLRWIPSEVRGWAAQRAPRVAVQHEPLHLIAQRDAFNALAERAAAKGYKLTRRNGGGLQCTGPEGSRGFKNTPQLSGWLDTIERPAKRKAVPA